MTRPAGTRSDRHEPPRHHKADVVLRDGSAVHVRPVRATDAPAVRAFFEHLSPKSIALRFFSSFPDLDRAVRWATEVDQHRYGLIATTADRRVNRPGFIGGSGA